NSLGTPEEQARGQRPEARGQFEAAPTASTSEPSSLGSAIQVVTTPWYQWFTPITWAIVLWLVGVAVFSIRLLVGFLALARMRRHGREAQDSVAELADAC